MVSASMNGKGQCIGTGHVTAELAEVTGIATLRGGCRWKGGLIDLLHVNLPVKLPSACHARSHACSKLLCSGGAPSPLLGPGPGLPVSCRVWHGFPVDT
jgi:hypothetical protein